MSDGKKETDPKALVQENPKFEVPHAAFNLPLRRDAFTSPIDYKKFVKSVERLVRGSMEYKEWVTYLKNELNIQECEITHERDSECSIEIHHHPISLYNICSIVLDTVMENKEKFSTFDIAQIVISLHFMNKVGYVPLLKSIHEKYHNGFLLIPIELCHGQWKEILLDFVIAPEIQMAVSKLSAVTKEHALQHWQRNSYVLENKSPDPVAIENKQEGGMPQHEDNK